MLKLSDTAKKMMFITCVIACVSVIIVSFLYGDYLKATAYVKGVFLGTGVSLLKIVLMEKQIAKVLDTELNAKNYGAMAFLLRLSLTAAVLILAAITPMFDLWGVIVGIVSLQVSAYIVSLFCV